MTENMTAAPSQNFNILSLSGGGFYGLYTISVIAALEEQTGQPFARHFDLIAGTSVGGILALGLAAEIPAADIKRAFENHGTTIFSNRKNPTTTLGATRDILRSVFSPKYKAEALRATVTEILGSNTKIGDLKHPIIVPAVNLTKGRPQIFKTPHHPTFKLDLHLNAADVAMATSAAPTYFPLAKVNDALFADGGLYANSPDILALHEAEYFLSVPKEKIELLSIGTTTAEFSFSHEAGISYGAAKWMRGQRLINAILSSQQASVDYMMRHKLGAHYLRLDILQSKEQEKSLALDIANETAQSTMRGLAQATVQKFINEPLLQRILASSAPKPTFYGAAK